MSRRPTPSTESCWAGSNSTNARADKRCSSPAKRGRGTMRSMVLRSMVEGLLRACFAAPDQVRGRHLPLRGEEPLLALVAAGGEAKAQRLQADKALGVALVVNLVFLEGDVREAVEAVRRLPSDDARQPLIQLQPHPPFDLLLALVDRPLPHLALGREPEAVVDQLGIARHQLVLEMHRAAVEAEALDAAMRRQQDRAARGLVDAARFHADKAVLDEIEAADTVLAAELVEAGQQGRGRQPFAIDRDGIAAREIDLDILRLVGRLLRRDRAAVDIFLGLDRGILQHLSLGRNV